MILPRVVRYVMQLGLRMMNTVLPAVTIFVADITITIVTPRYSIYNPYYD